MQPGDIAFKSNFATLDPFSGIVLHRRADRRFEEEGPPLCAALDGLQVPGYPEHTISVKYATEHRCGVVVRGPGLTDQISGTDPLKDNLPLQIAAPLDATPEAAHTAAVINAVNKLIQGVLETHPINEERRKQGKYPANVVLLRGCGCRLALTPFVQLHNMRPCIVSPTKIIAGLGMCAEMDVITVPGTTGDYRTLFHRKAEAVADALISGPYEFAFLHVKAVDDAGHDREVDLKVAYLEVVDKMVGQLLRLLWEAEERSGSTGNSVPATTSDGIPPTSTAPNGTNTDSTLHQQYTIVVTGDHSTPVEFGDHSNEPVPLAIAHVRHAVRALGGTAAVKSIPLGPIPHPKAEESSISSSMPVIAPALAFLQQNGGSGAGGSANASVPQVNGTSKSADAVQSNNTALNCLFGDSVCRFTEFDAVQGALGRFPGSQVMTVVKQYAGVIT